MKLQKTVSLIGKLLIAVILLIIVNVIVIEPIRHKLPSKSTPYEEFSILNPIKVAIPENYALLMGNTKAVGNGLFIVSVRNMLDYDKKNDKVLLVNNKGVILDFIDVVDVYGVYYYMPDVVSILQGNMITKVFQVVNGSFVSKGAYNKFSDISKQIYQSYSSTKEKNYAQNAGSTTLSYSQSNVSNQYSCGVNLDVEGYSCPNPRQKIRVGLRIVTSRAYKVVGNAQISENQWAAIIGPMDKVDLLKNQLLIFGDSQ